MLGGLAAFVGDNFAAAAALQPARGENKMTLANEVLAALGAAAPSRLKDVQLSGWLGEEDAALAAAMEQALLRQQELLHTWEGALHHMLHPDEPDEPDEPDGADGAARGWAAGPQAQQLVATRYNGLLRRLWGASEVLLGVRDALRATLPAKYRWSRAVNHLLLGNCWIRSPG